MAAAARRAFSDTARGPRLPAPRGMALIGVPGTGKSLTARKIGGLWGCRCCGWNVGALFGFGRVSVRARSGCAPRLESAGSVVQPDRSPC
ncbi:hypothetical protein GCM10018793_17880 [Streptomyces sulfonofaciens]|uniref:ATPase AAA-type core domain-containing protein n=1 Tax=Streptomyces sulfonofaciens TaxID=68272 RepID=A0A919KWQ3_9ACTN|nr:hypothetical protein GCM10018793_17880 [Streptomyces sulfonofaciens]